MNAASALAEQIEIYRRMTGEQRLAIALDLREMSCDIAREGIRRLNRSGGFFLSRRRKSGFLA